MIAFLGVALAAASAYAANRHSKREGNKNRRFQKDMDDTKWQRTVEDMKDAGINPMVAYGQGPSAGTPPGAMSTGKDADLGSTAISAQREKNERKMLDKSLEKTQAETTAIKENTRIATAKAARDENYGDSLLGRNANSIIRIIRHFGRSLGLVKDGKPSKAQKNRREIFLQWKNRKGIEKNAVEQDYLGDTSSHQGWKKSRVRRIQRSDKSLKYHGRGTVNPRRGRKK